MDLKSLLAEFVASRPGDRLDKLMSEVRAGLVELAADGVVPLGEDKDLTGDSLEVRVATLLRTAGFAVARGRAGREDLVVSAPQDSRLSRPIVIEIKSDRKPTVQIQDLRQLDDWVFDLSQEYVARKQGLGGGPDPLAMATDGLMTSRRRHPTPHKGILVFNGPIGQPFDRRASPPLAGDLLAFAVQRCFCVIPFGHLIRDLAAVGSDGSLRRDLWSKWQETEGLLE